MNVIPVLTGVSTALQTQPLLAPGGDAGLTYVLGVELAVDHKARLYVAYEVIIITDLTSDGPPLYLGTDLQVYRGGAWVRVGPNPLPGNTSFPEAMRSRSDSFGPGPFMSSTPTRPLHLVYTTVYVESGFVESANTSVWRGPL